MLQTKKEIIEWLEKMKVTTYSINDDLTVNALYINLDDKGLTEIPIQFNETRSFSCERNKLTSLKGCPVIVDGTFKCSENLLTSLEHAPIKVTSSFYCDDNQLTTLKWVPDFIGNVFSCQSNLLTSLEFCPNTVMGNFYCCRNSIQDFTHAPAYIGKTLFSRFNPIKNWESLLSIEIEEVVSHAIKDPKDIPHGFESFYFLNDGEPCYVTNLSTREIKNILLYNGINEKAKNNIRGNLKINKI